MKTAAPLLLLAASLLALPALAQERVWRCGNEYTNNATVAQQRGCKVMEGGNVTVVQGASRRTLEGSQFGACFHEPQVLRTAID
ncbi:hypothetical protein ACEN8K_33110, partial [Variovorax sp. CT11-76]